MKIVSSEGDSNVIEITDEEIQLFFTLGRAAFGFIPEEGFVTHLGMKKNRVREIIINVRNEILGKGLDLM